MRIPQTLLILTLSVFLLAGCSSDKPQDNKEANTNTSKTEQTNKIVREVENSEKDGTKAKGSCNAIDESSTCIEYYGTLWNDMQIKMMCEGSGTFSSNPCPNNMAGGCNTGTDTEADMVVWMYYGGEGEITPESLKYAKMACDANMSSKWITTK